MKKLKTDPWENVAKKYKVNDIVEGKVLKTNPFGLFVELDPEIHGLAHISELSSKPVTNINEIAKIGDKLKFKIVSIEPKDHRLGLSIKAIKEPAAASSAKSEETASEKTETKEAPKEKPAEKEVKAEKAEAKKEKPVKEPAKEKKPKIEKKITDTKKKK